MRLKRNFLPRLMFLAMLLLMLYVGIYIYASGRMQCVIGGYERVDWFSNGIGQPTEGRDGSPAVSIYRAPLVPNTVLAINDFFNATLLISCEDDDYSTTPRIAYVELRSEALSQAVIAWQQGINNASGFRSGSLHTDRVAASYDGQGRGGRVWNAAYALKPAPDWLPKEQINEQAFVAFWGDGHLFKGRLTDQYFWIGYRL